MTELTPDDIASAKVPTHIVTDIVYGKNLAGILKLTNSERKDSLKASGSLKVQLLKIPIGGSGDIHFDRSSFEKNYNFEARLISNNYGDPLNCDSLDSYLAQVKKWFENPGEPSII